MIDFSVGEPDFNTPGNVIQAAEHAMAEGFTKYTQASGLPALRQAIADKLRRENNLDYEADQIIVSCGAKHVLYNLAMVLVDPGDEVIIPGPYWVTYPTQVEMAGGVPVIIPTTAAEGFKITGAELRRYLTPATKGIILNSPCNPTGAVYTPTNCRTSPTCWPTPASTSSPTRFTSTWCTTACGRSVSPHCRRS